jgi:polysaccharide deacetylase family protein (PEP-CTERM system associated)
MDRRRDEAGVNAAAVMKHAFSVDVEDWYHGIPVPASVKSVAPRRLEKGLFRLLDVMKAHGVLGTFFVLGPLTRDNAAAVRRIADDGHEIGCHGWSHDLIYEMGRERFEAETRQARDAIADATGRPVRAYRAAYFSITRQSFWALEILASLGFQYDSSIFPVVNWRYGMPDFPRDPTIVETAAGPIWEFPISVLPVGSRTMPVSGGAYFRLYPYAVTHANFRRSERLGRPVIFYLHPWELDPDHPRVPFHWKPRFTHYVNLRTTEVKLTRLLGDFRFGTIAEVIESRR